MGEQWGRMIEYLMIVLCNVPSKAHIPIERLPYMISVWQLLLRLLIVSMIIDRVAIGNGKVNQLIHELVILFYTDHTIATTAITMTTTSITTVTTTTTATAMNHTLLIRFHQCQQSTDASQALFTLMVRVALVTQLINQPTGYEHVG